MQKHLTFLFGLFFIATSLSTAQSKRPLDFDVYETWKGIRGATISSDGKWVIYSQKAQNKDATLKIHQIGGREEKVESFSRGEQARVSYDSRFVIFKIKPHADSIKAMRRRKVKKTKFPKDALGIYNLRKDTLIEVKDVNSFQLPKKSGNWLAYHLAPAKPLPPKPKVAEEVDSTALEENSETPEEKQPEKQEEGNEKKGKDKKGKKNKKEKEEVEEVIEETVPEVKEETPLEIAQKRILELEGQLKKIEDDKKAEEARKKIKPKKIKKESKENGSTLVLFNLNTSQLESFPFVKTYLFDETGTKLSFSSTGNDSTFQAGVYVYDLKTSTLSQVLNLPGKHFRFGWDKAGTQLAFIADTDTSKAHKKDLIKYHDLYYWQEKQKTAVKLADKDAQGMLNNWMVSPNKTPLFSKDGAKLFFGTQPEPLVQDTTLLPEEIVKVDIWNWKDSRLQSQQVAELNNDRKKAYFALIYPKYKRVIQLETPEIPEIQIVNEGIADYVLGRSNKKYEKEISWVGFPRYYDYYIINLRDGRKRQFQEKLRATVQMSPGGQYAYWYAVADSSWYTYALKTGQTINLTKSINNRFYDELHDSPDAAGWYGSAGWTENDAAFLIYDRYDIWKFDPLGKIPGQNITLNGRNNRIRYRYQRLDPEARFIASNVPMILSAFDEETKSSGYFSINLSKSEVPRKLILDDYRFSGLQKSRTANAYMFTRETFNEFPDLYYTDLTFTKINRISNANPQIQNYWWGTSELVKWTAPNGEELHGVLYKPENFDPNKKYPMISYFYERVSQRLHYFFSPLPARSSINISMYVSNGYLVFMPDIPYRVGHPGQSAYEAVLSGVTSLLKTGYVDRDKLGIQGHSWGGYQVAYIVTKTDLFAAAMSGAPVSNMTSAYGGIRWASGLSRMFQYERSQSRLGATLWEKPFLYLENSPLFYADEVNTPLLMLHNDDDGAVPWYQGIEFFVALRRLNKPVWMLNYNGEKHGLTQWQNKKDFSIRRMQFFDYYLKFKAEPSWMKKGVPAIEKGIKPHYELVDTEK